MAVLNSPRSRLIKTLIMELPFSTFCKEAGLRITCDHLAALQKFVDLYTEQNKVINLTRFSTCEEFFKKHIIDALMVTPFFDIRAGMRVADVGTGGGLPGIPLAILNPNTHFTLVDSVQKKIRCVQEFIHSLGLKNVVAMAERLEAVGQDKQFRETFDLVISRALAPLPILLELAMPLVKIGGTFIAMKGPHYSDEIMGAQNAMKELKINQPSVEFYELAEEAGKRTLLIFKKDTPTPSRYPRRVGTPNKSPL